MLQSIRQIEANIALRRLPSIRPSGTLVWIEDLCTSSKIFDNNDEKFINSLDPFYNHFIVRYTSILKSIKYIKQARSYERMIVVIVVDDSDSIDKQLSINPTSIIQLDQYQQIQSILIISSKTDFSSYIGDNIMKRVKIFANYESMITQLEHLIKEVEESDDNLLRKFHQRDKSLKDVRRELGPFVWSYSYRALLLAMPHDSPEAKREMLAECRAYYRGKHEQLSAINNFQRNYCSIDAIKWYTKPCFLHHVINKALRTEDMFALYTFRYFITDLSTCIEKAMTLTRARYPVSFRVYRGTKLSKDEVEDLRVGTLVATNGYMSSSIHLNVAQLFIGINPTTGMSPSRGRDDKRQYVLFEIDVNLNCSPEINVADVSDCSTVPDEKEILFDLGTTFIITNIKYDIEHSVWHITMVTSSEMAQRYQDYSAYISRRLADTSPAMMFGHLLSDISSDYSSARKYFHRLLQTIPVDDEDRPTIYFYLGRLYRFIGKYKLAIAYLRCALLLQKRKLPQSSMGYGRALAGLATTYSELGESAKAVSLYEKAMAIERAFLPADHVEMALLSNRLAYAYWQEKRYEHALAHLFNTLTFYKLKMPADHPGQAQTLHTIGLVYHSLDNREKALDYYTQALHMRQSLLSDDHPFVACTYYQMSLLHAEQNDKRTIALEYAQKALNIRNRKLPPNHDELKQSIELVKRLS